MSFKRIFELAQNYVEPDPLMDVAISWPKDTWLSKRRAELALKQAEDNDNEQK